jgi:glutathione S-transferase
MDQHLLQLLQAGADDHPERDGAYVKLQLFIPIFFSIQGPLPRREIDGLTGGWQILKARYGLGEPDPAVVEKARTELEPTLDIMAHRLSVAPYFAGENFSLADIAYMPEMDMLIKSKCQDMVDARPPLAAWWQRVSSRPSWLKVDGITVDKGTKPFDD